MTLPRLSVALLLLSLACTRPFAPVYGRRSLAPTAAMQAWYDSAAACAHGRADFGRVQWFAADSIVRAGLDYGGEWLAPHGIVLSERELQESRPYPLRGVVWHESIHESRQLYGHTAPVWCECDPLALAYKDC